MEKRIIDMIIFFSFSFLSYLKEGIELNSESKFQDKLTKEYKIMSDNIEQIMRSKLICCSNSVAEIIKFKLQSEINENEKKMLGIFYSEVVSQRLKN